MSEEQENVQQTEDPISRMMFGSSRQPVGKFEPEINEEENHEAEIEAAAEEFDTNREGYRERDWLFGRRHRPIENEFEIENENNQENNILDNVNFEELMYNIDNLVSSTDQLKPLFKKVTPFLNQFLKK